MDIGEENIPQGNSAVAWQFDEKVVFGCAPARTLKRLGSGGEAHQCGMWRNMGSYQCPYSTAICAS